MNNFIKYQSLVEMPANLNKVLVEVQSGQAQHRQRIRQYDIREKVLVVCLLNASSRVHAMVISIFYVVIAVTTELNFRTQLFLGFSLTLLSFTVFEGWRNAPNLLMCLVGHEQRKQGPDVDKVEQ